MRDRGVDEALRVLEVSKRHFKMITFRFERLPCGRQVDHAIHHGLK